MVDDIPAAWTTTDPVEVKADPSPKPPPRPAPEPLHQQYAPHIPAHAPSAAELLVYALQLGAEQTKIMVAIQNLTTTIAAAAWCNTDGEARCKEWSKSSVDCLMKAGAVAGFLVGRATE